MNHNRQIVSAGGMTTEFNGYPLLKYQRPLVDACTADLLAGIKELLLAACPAAGKTMMCFWVLRELLRAGHINRALLIAHGSLVLKAQVTASLARHAPDLVPFVDVCIPQEYRKIEGPYPIVVSDEAHEFYDAGEDSMVEKIIRRVGARQRFIMTASPARFIRRGVKLHAFSLGQLHESGYASDFIMDVALSDYEIRESDWNDDGEVKGRVRYTQAQTDRTLGRLMRELKSAVRLGEVSSMIVAANVAMADQIQRGLKKLGIIAGVSHSESDAGETIDEFREAALGTLVVVRRARIGFDMPLMVNLIDLSGSRNREIVFNMAGRLARPHPEGWQKHFVKVMPRAFSGKDVLLFMSSVRSLRSYDDFVTWDGGRLNRAPVEEVRMSKGVGGSGRVSYKPAFFPGMRMFDNAFNRPGLTSMSLGSARTFGEATGVVQQDAARKKEEIFRWVMEAKRLPLRGDPLHDAYRCYVGRSHNTYDPGFVLRLADAGYGPRRFGVSILRTDPAVAAEWHPTRNGALMVSEVSRGSKVRAWWLCPMGHEYNTLVCVRCLAGTGCRRCADAERGRGNSRPVQDETGKAYPSMTAAGKAIGRTFGAVSMAVCNGGRCAGLRWRYVDGPPFPKAKQ